MLESVQLHISFNMNNLTTTQPIETPELNGLHCPECEEELLDSHPNTILTTHPARKEVKCSSCDYTGYRIIW